MGLDLPWLENKFIETLDAVPGTWMIRMSTISISLLVMPGQRTMRFFDFTGATH
jgi:hypothetical protein